MNPTWPAVDNWLDLLGNLWIGLVVIAVAVVPSWYAARSHVRIKDAQRIIGEVRDSVINNHGDIPLRDDIDRITEAVKRVDGKVELLGESIGRLREDDADERKIRRSEIGELREDVDSRFSALNRRIDPL